MMCVLYFPYKGMPRGMEQVDVLDADVDLEAGNFGRDGGVSRVIFDDGSWSR